MLEDEADTLSIREVAGFLGVSEKSVRRWVAAGLIPASRYGPRALRVNKNDLVDYIESCRIVLPELEA